MEGKAPSLLGWARGWANLCLFFSFLSPLWAVLELEYRSSRVPVRHPGLHVQPLNAPEPLNCNPESQMIGH